MMTTKIKGKQLHAVVGVGDFSNAHADLVELQTQVLQFSA